MARSTVLVVEDDFEIRESLVDLLVEDGFHAVPAENGRDGLFELKTHPEVAVILLDLSMPIMDGGAFRSAQLADPALASIPVVVLSADRNCAQRAAQMGAAACLSKPFSPPTLLHTLRRFH